MSDALFDVDLVSRTSGATTDIRASWPACILWQEAKP